MFKFKSFKLLTLLICVICIFSFYCPKVTAASKSDETDRILSNIFTNYKKDVHPSTSRADGAVVVGLTIIPLFIDIDEPSSVFNCHFWFGMFWRDTRLQWDPRQYSNVTLVHVAPENVWKPDLRMFNGIQHEDYEDTDVLVNAPGSLFWVPPVTSHTSCSLDFTYWPWDVQKCELNIGSWTRHGWDIDVVNMDNKNRTKVSTDNFVPALWNIMSARAKRNVKYFSGIDQPWPDVTVRFVIQRASSVDKKLAVLPLIIVACLSLSAFWTHPLSRNRITLACLNIFILIITLFYLRTRLPRAGAQIPFVVSFAGSLSVLVTIQFLVALSMINLVSRLDDPPSWLVGPLKSILGKILCISDLPLVGPIRSIDVEALQRTIDNNAVAPTGDANAMAQSKFEISGWTLFAQAVDRIMFVSYLLIILIFLGAYLGGAKGIIDKYTK